MANGHRGTASLDMRTATLRYISIKPDRMKKIFIAFTLFSCALRANAQWTTLEANTGEGLRSVHFRSNGNVWLGGFDTLQWSSNSGDDFIERPTMIFGNAPIFGLYTAVHALNNSTALITGTMNLGEAETICRTTDGGLTWSIVHDADYGPIDLLNDLEFAQPPLGFAVGSNGRILRSTDAGLSWSAVPTGSVWSFQRIAWCGGATYIAGGMSVFMRSTDSGSSWTVISGPDGVSDLTCIGGICHATSEGSIWRSTDAGLTWQVSGTSMGEVLEMLDATTLITANDTGMFRSITSGAYWEQLVTPGYRPVFQVDFHDDQNGIAVGEHGYVIRTGNAGGPGLPIALFSAPSTSLCSGTPVVFENNGDPANSYQWRIDGVPVSSAYDLNTTFTDEGVHVIQLVATNGNGSHESSLSVNVTASPSVLPFSASAALDTLCNGSSTTIVLPSSQAGTLYKLFRGSVQQGQTLSGGGVLSFPTGAINEPIVFNVLGIRTNSCGADTFVVEVPLVVPYADPGVTWSFTNVEGCAPYTPVVRIQNSSQGSYYKVNNQSVVLGTGGILNIPMPQVSGNATVTANVRTYFVGQSCQGALMGPAQSIQVYNAPSGVSVDQDPVGDARYALVGQSRYLNFNPVAGLNYSWNFGSDATPATFVGQPPPPFQYATPGEKTITMVATSPLGVCTTTTNVLLTVVDSVAAFQVPVCGGGATEANVQVLDMCIDVYNNRYLTGYRNTPTPSNQQAFFAMKLDSSGQEVWRYEGPPTSDWQNQGSYGYGIAADRAGNAYVTGFFYHNVRQIAGVSIYHPNFLVKIDRFGELAWQMTSPTNKFRGVICTEDDLVHVVGYNAFGGLDLFLPSGERDLTVYPANDPQRGDLFMLDVGANGSLLGKRTFGQWTSPSTPGVWQSMNVSSNSLDTQDRVRCDPVVRKDPMGGFLIAGVMHTLPTGAVCDIGGTLLESHVPASSVTNERQVYIIGYTPGVGVTSAFSCAGGRPRSVQGVSRSASGQYVVCGRYNTPLLFDGQEVLPEPVQQQSPRLFSYAFSADSDGGPLWQATAPISTTIFEDVAFASDGSIHMPVGYTAMGMLPSVGGALLGAGSNDEYGHHGLARYSTVGVLQGFRPGPSGRTSVFNLRPDACGALHMVAYNQSATGVTASVFCEVIAPDGCSPGCFAANDPGLRDVELERISLDDMGSQNPVLQVTFQNLGQVDVNSARVHYRVNEGPVQIVEWSGDLEYQDHVIDLQLGPLSFVGRYSNRVVAWIDQVNGASDDLLANDTVRYEHFLCTQPLNGTYSCGGDGADFKTFREVTTVLHECGVDGPTTIAIADGLYREQLWIRPIPGVSASDTVVFTSASADSASVLLHFHPGPSTLANGVVVLDDSCSFISLTDLSLSHRVPGPGNHLIFVLSHANALNILRNHLVGNPNDDDQLGVWIRPNVGGTFRVDQNTIEFGSSGIGFNGASGSVFGTCSANGNSLINQSRRALYASSLDQATVVGNRIISEEAFNGSLYEAVHVLGVQAGGLRFDENFIRVATDEPVYTAEAVVELVRVCFGGSGSARGSMANNMIFNSLATDYNTIPLLSIECGNVDVLNNTFGGITKLYPEEGLTMRNNIFYNPEVAFALDLMTNVPADMVSEDNLFSCGPNGDYPAVLRYQGTGRSLGQWRTLTGLDMNSAQVRPQFVSPDDLHLEGDNFFTCPTLSGVTSDIDGDPRALSITRHGADVESLFTSMAEGAISDGLVVVPNPSRGEARLELHQAERSYQLDVFDAVGRSVHSTTVLQGRTSVPIALRPKPGIYHVVLSFQGQQFGTAKWVVAGE